MVRGLLVFFGVLNAIIGVLVVFFSFGAGRPADVFYGISLGSGAFIAGILLVGFGKIIQLLEELVKFASPPPIFVAPDGPRVGNHTMAVEVRRETYAGRRYGVHGDGTVLSVLGNGNATWRTEQEFRAWADRNPVS